MSKEDSVRDAVVSLIKAVQPEDGKREDTRTLQISDEVIGDATVLLWSRCFPTDWDDVISKCEITVTPKDKA